MSNPTDRRWLCIELPTLPYADARDLQGRLVSAVADRRIDTNVILMLEHFPVFTLGRRGGLDNLTVSEDVLKHARIPVIHSERGGNITFHGPGQLIVYPIINLRAARMSVGDYVENLEETMILTAHQWGVGARRNPVNRGIWVGNNKLGSIGIAIRHGISFHGLALNVNGSLEPFGWIRPCGLQAVGVTSMEQESSHSLSLSQVQAALKGYLETVFGIKLVPISLAALEKKESCTDTSLGG